MEILAENDLLSAVKEGTLIQDGREESCEGIKYDFTLSSLALTVDSKGPVDMDQSKENAMIKPGEIAFVMTKESLDLPNDIYCQLSTKRKLSLDGIVILGGLIIDPNYKGKLIFGLYNLSSRNYPLRPGKKLVAGVFYRVDKKSDKKPDPINDFPDELIKIVIDTKPNSASAINTAIGDINNVINELRVEMYEIKKNLDRDNEWKTDFQNKLTHITDLVMKMGEKLDTEIDTRKNENLQIKNDHVTLKETVMPLSKTEKHIEFFKGAIVAIIIGVILYIIEKIIG
jgi:deoxycytidine triphosphate deaminase